jgi:nuclear protein localization protein 4 homolog
MPSTSSSSSSSQAPVKKQPPPVTEDPVDVELFKLDGRIERKKDPNLCRHTNNSRCVHCSSLEPYDENYLKEQKIKHLSFHSYLRKATSGMSAGKFVAFEDINCKIKPGCHDHLPYPKGICSKCQPSAITLNRQIYRHVDNVMFENNGIVDEFLNYWRVTGHQRIGFLYGAHEVNPDVPLGIRARIVAIYEPPQESTKNSVKLLEDENDGEVQEMAALLGLKKLGWIFTDLLNHETLSGKVKHLRGIDTFFLTAKECILAGHFQNLHPNPCRYSSNGFFGSKFVTICVTGERFVVEAIDSYSELHGRSPAMTDLADLLTVSISSQN